MRDPAIRCKICGEVFDFVFDDDGKPEAELSKVCEACDSPLISLRCEICGEAVASDGDAEGTFVVCEDCAPGGIHHGS